eukprot:gene20942-22995_t
MSGLKMLHININGLLGKLDFVKIIAERTKFDVLSVNETKIAEDIEDEDISLQGYKVFRKDRNWYGGGVLMYVSEALESLKVDDLEEEQIKGVWAKISLRRNAPIVVGSIYRPPRSGSNLRDIEVLHVYLDQDICNTLGAVQLINEPARETESTSSLIDILITTKEEFIRESGAADKHAPKRTIRVDGIVHNTFSDELIMLMKERDKARLIASRSKKDEDWTAFKKLRNKVTNTKNKEKKAYFKDQIENAKDSKEM